MLLLVMGDNFVLMFFGWEGVGLCSYLLIGFWYTDREKAAAGMKAFVVNRIGDFGFLLGLFLLVLGPGLARARSGSCTANAGTSPPRQRTDRALADGGGQRGGGAGAAARSARGHAASRQPRRARRREGALATARRR